MLATAATRSEDEHLPLWRIRASADGASPSADAVGDCHGLIARILRARGLATPEEARAFLEPDLRSLHDPFSMADMGAAVDRVHGALESGERMVVYGDYDADGVTSTAVLVTFLRACGGEVEPYVPRRLEEGYGLNVSAVERLAALGAGLIVTCDCGVSATEEVARAAELGVDVVVIDHHRVPERRPPAVAILDPHRDDCAYPFPDLAAVGVVFKLLMALRKRLRESGWFSRRGLREPNLREMLDLVAVGTVADVVPLTGENRILAAHGLRVLAEGRRVGLRALKAAAGIDAGPIGAGQVAFKLAPMINAAGRLDDARAGFDLILSDDPFHAARLAGALDVANAERRRLEQEILEQALEQAAMQPRDDRGLVLCGDGWHPGVVGIVASRIVERYHRPTLILGRHGDEIQGSGRSIGRFHLYEALDACSAHLKTFGGHKAAAGLRLSFSQLPVFRDTFLSRCRERLSEDDLVPVLTIDAELDPSAVDVETADAIEMLAPFGAGNPAPVFVAREARLEECRLVGRPGPDGARHLKARVGGIEAIGFGLGRAARLEGLKVDLAYTVGFNHWRGRRSMQIGLKAVVCSGGARIEHAASQARS